MCVKFSSLLRFLTILLCILVVLLCCSVTVHAQVENPLAPAETSSSPRQTVKSFVDNVDKMIDSFAEDYSSETGRRNRAIYGARAVGCLDLSKVPPTVKENAAVETMVLLAEILYRLDLSDLDAEPAEGEDKNRYQIPNTEIRIVKQTEGPHKGEYLFSSDTVANAKLYYERIKHKPYIKQPSLANFYEIYILGPGPWIPLDWILSLPQLFKDFYLGQPLWKWLALLVLVSINSVLLIVMFRVGSRKKEEDPTAPLWRRLLFPLSGLAVAESSEYLVSHQIRLSGDILFVIETLLTILMLFSTAWLILILGNALANRIISSPRIQSRSIDSHLIRVTFRIITIGLLVLLFLAATKAIGIPLTPVLAGLGVGGIAVALAAQNSVENFLGGLNLFIDRPVRVGDFCKFGDRMGTVEEIGLRCTRVRTLDRTVVSVPNSSFAKMELENYTRRDKIRFCPRVALRLDTTPNQMRYVLVEIRKMLYSHPMVDPEPARVRFVGFGQSSLELDFFVYVKVTDYGQFLEVSEDLNLRILQIIDEAGTGLAVPARRTFMDTDPGLDERRTQHAEREVDNWRQDNRLYLPSFPADVIEELSESISYPETGGTLAEPTMKEYDDDDADNNRGGRD